MIRETSRTAYCEDVLPKLRPKQQYVLNFMEPYRDYTNNELAELAGLPINEVTPRTGELCKMKRIFIARRRRCAVRPGRDVTAYQLTQETLF